MPEELTVEEFLAPQVPGSMEICTTCANHRQHYNGPNFGDAATLGPGWIYCDLAGEAQQIRPCTMAYCHWFSPGGITRRTPRTDGMVQALSPEWPGPPGGPELAKEIVARRNAA